MLKVGEPMEYTALYREWRPSNFDEIVGQDYVVRILKNQITSNRISHAYLFCGPRGTGKTSTAKIFAKAINCEDPEGGNPCGNCHVCEIIDSENNMDVIEIDAASNTGVDHIREIRDKVKYPPSAGRFRVYIIDEVHMLSQSAFNAFLKTLEEPPEHIVFILATTEPHKLPSTILSRCQRYDFRRITLKVIMDRLKTIANGMGVEVEEGALETIARWSEGGMRDSISLLDQCISFSGPQLRERDVLAILGTASKDFLFDVVNNIAGGDISSILMQIDSFVEEGGDISVFLKDLIYHLRNLLIVRICEDPTVLLDVSQSTLELYRKQAQKMDQSRLIRAIEILSALDADIKWNTKPRIMLEMAMVRICRPQDEKSLEALMDRIVVLERQVAQGITIDHTSNADVLSASKAADGDREKTEQTTIPTWAESQHTGEVEAHQGISLMDNKEKEAVKTEEKSEERTAKGKSDIGESIEKAVLQKPDIEKVWSDILKKVRKDRMAIFTLLRETKLQLDKKNKNLVNLIFPSHQGFYVAAIEKDENRKYIEELLAEATGQSYKLRCYTEDSAPTPTIMEDVHTTQDDQEEAMDDIVQRAIDIFGEEYVEVIDD